MATIQFDNGIKEFDVNGKAIIRFNPLDVATCHRFANSFEKCKALTEECDGTPEGIEKLDQDIMCEICAVFGDISPAFEGVSPTAISGGLPVWANFYMAIMEAMDENLKGKHELSERAKKYLAKYQK